VGEFSIKIPEPAREVEEAVWETTFEVHARGAVPSTLTFRKPRISVGRAPENDIPLVKSRRASKRHCTLLVENGEVRIEDNGSTNCTWLNGRRIQESPFDVHDQLYVGELVIMLVAPPTRVR
jgi:pSer/pThr/pTyr-binding forkhead associated (FHA) protein